MRRLWYVIPALLLGACATQPEESDPSDDVVDLRFELPAAPADGEQFVTGDMLIPPHTEKQWCFFSTYTGPDVGVYSATFSQAEYGHHVIIEASHADPEDIPDGTVVDCTGSTNEMMTDVDPIVTGTEPTDEPNIQYRMTLPEGMAVALDSGTRLVIQSHYVNTTDKTILVRDGINMSFMTPESVREWAAMFAHTDSSLELPPLQETELKVTCQWDQDVYLLFVTGHMHEYGTYFSVDWTRGDGTTTRLYEVPEWKVDYRDNPIFNRFEEGELLIKAGDTFTTTCRWFNTTDQPLAFPQEMCATPGMLYPSKVPMICDLAP